MRFYSTEKLGPSQSQLPNGALLCEGVVIARTGQQLYHAAEIGVGSDDPWSAGAVLVERDADEVFDPDSMASFEGSAVVMRHPPGAVAPDNWRDLAVGHVQNVRRQGNVLVADLVIQDKRAIDAIRNGGWRGISCGYNASYERAQDGRMRQTDITGNHIAILPPGHEPRCGSMCMIGDAQSHRTTRKGTKVETGQDVLQSLRRINVDLARLARRRRTRDADDLEGQQQTRTGGVISRPTVGPKRILKLDGPASSYHIMSGGDGVWLVQSTEIEGIGDPGNRSDIPRPVAASVLNTDALARHRAITAQRDAGRQFGERLNQAARQRWGR